MKKLTAVTCSLALHFIFLTSLATTSAVAVQIAADRATYATVG